MKQVPYLTKSMAPSQIEEAQRLAIECVKKDAKRLQDSAIYEV